MACCSSGSSLASTWSALTWSPTLTRRSADATRHPKRQIALDPRPDLASESHPRRILGNGDSLDLHHGRRVLRSARLLLAGGQTHGDHEDQACRGQAPGARKGAARSAIHSSPIAGRCVARVDRRGEASCNIATFTSLRRVLFNHTRIENGACIDMVCSIPQRNSPEVSLSGVRRADPFSARAE